MSKSTIDPSSHPNWPILQKCLQREWRQKLLMAFGLFDLGLLILIFAFNKSSLLAIVGAIALFFGLQFGFRTLREYPLIKHPLNILLAKRPRDIVWVYSVVTEWMPFGLKFGNSSLMYFKLIDGDELCLSIPEKHIENVSKFLNELLPHATFGYSQDREQWFMAAPELLIRYDEEASE